jgi:C-terminal processing protease CtpA/Prc
VLCFLSALSWGQEFTSSQREQAQAMLRDVSADVKNHYYDANFHGLDWDANVREEKEKIDKATSWNMALSYVAAALDHLQDSHTFFIPPPRSYLHDYGFRMQMIGDHCYAIRVRPGSDAEAKGLRAGDEILAVDGYTPTRDDFGRINFLFMMLRPQRGLRLKVHQLSGSDNQIDIIAKITGLPATVNSFSITIDRLTREREDDQARSIQIRYVEKGDDLLIVKLPQFRLSLDEVDAAVGKMKKHKAVILDLRGNPGGAEETLKWLVGEMFESDVKIGERIERKSTRPVEAKSLHRGFTGKLVVLVDSYSASASESFARVIQLEKRGAVLGDRTSGSLMAAQHYTHQAGGVYYGTSITQADIKMSDGQSLERVGVIPDTVILPTAADLGVGRDPTMIQAAAMLGVKITPEESGTLFPYEWPRL